MTTKILIADDHKLMRQGLRALLEKQDDIEVIGEAGDGRSTLKLTEELKPHVVIVDVAMPGMNGIDATRRLTSDFPGIKVLGLSMHSDRRFISEMLRAGASGYLLKDSAFEELARAIRTVMANEIYLSPKIAGVVLEDYVQQLSNAKPSSASVLTAREREVLQLLAEGKTTKQIALVLSVSAKTIETHRQNIMRKLDVFSVAELTKYAVREGLTSLEP